MIAVGNGTYAKQSITGSKAAPGVTFSLASGDASAGLDIHATNITFFGAMRLDWRTYSDASGITFKNVKHEWFGIWSSTNVGMYGGESYCPGAGHNCDYDPQIVNQSGSSVAPQDIVIDGVNFHDWRRPSGSDWHTECLQVGSGVNVEIRNSTFTRCATHDIFIRSWGSGYPLKNWNIHNNVFTKTDEGFFVMQFAGDLNQSSCTGNKVVNNQIGQDVRVLDCQVQVSGNSGP